MTDPLSSLKPNNDKCEDCSVPATYICICEEEKLCEECLVVHVKEDSSLKHRIVSLFHPLVSLFESSNDGEEDDQANQVQEQILALKEFRDQCVDLIDSKIKSTADNETPGLIANKSFTPIPLNLHSSFRSIRPELSVRESKFPVSKSFETRMNPGSIYRVSQMSSFESYFYKIIITGGSKVGKSCIIESFKQIHSDVNESVGMVFNSILCENLKVNLEVVEDKAVGGCAECLGALVVFDLTSKESFEYAKGLVKLLEANAVVMKVVILVGTRLDLVSARSGARFASFTAIQNYAMGRGVLYDEISAVNYAHVQELFMRLVRELYKKSNEY